MKEFKFKSNHFKDILLECQKYQDLAITCWNGKFQCNSFLFVTIFPKLSNVLHSESCQYDNNPSLIVPDVDVNDLHQFFNNIYSYGPKFLPGKSLLYLFSWKDSASSKQGNEIVTDMIEEFVKVEPKPLIEEEPRYDSNDVDYQSDEFTPPQERLVKIDILKTVDSSIKRKRGRPRKVIDENSVAKRFPCDQCPKSFKSDQTRKDHIQHVHEGVPRPKIKKHRARQLEECDKVCDCGIDFKNNDEKIKHYRIVHKGCIECPDCERVLKEHLFGSHKCDPQNKEKSKRGGGICPHCGKVCLTYGNLYYHKNFAHANGSYPCDTCGRVYPSTASLQDHVSRKCQVKVKECTLCGAKVKHMREHLHAVHREEKDKRFQCGICGKGFYDKKKLANHEMSMHIKTRPHRCRYGCDIGYNDISNRNAHERKTHGQRFDLAMKNNK